MWILEFWKSSLLSFCVPPPLLLVSSPQNNSFLVVICVYMKALLDLVSAHEICDIYISSAPITFSFFLSLSLFFLPSTYLLLLSLSHTYIYIQLH